MYERIDNIDLYKGTAAFISNNVLEVNGEQITAPKIFITAGARASIPPIKGLEGTPYITYKEALRQTELPKKMIIVGGGFIAVELGYFYAMMGTEVHFLVREKLMRPLDDDVIEEFTEALQSKVKVHCEPNILRVHHDGNDFTVMTENEIYQADALFMATGMQPNTDLLKCENTDIELDDRGFIKVNDHFETSVPGIYAFGDILGRYMFRHTANYEGEYVFKHVFGGHKEPIKYPPVPYAVFSNPQIGGVGESEKSLQKKGIEYIVGKNNYKNSAMGMALLSEEGFCKLLFDKQTKKLLGAHIVGKEASNMVHMCIAYMKFGGTLDDMLDTIYIHPALPEIVRNAARKAAAEFSKQ
jgi:dihydrolipoamide dehydrogenase